MVAGGAYRGRMRRVSKIGVPLGLAVVAGVTGGLVALGVANAGQQPRGDNRVVSDISSTSASPTASPSPSATASPIAVPTQTVGTQAALVPAPTHAAKGAVVEATDPATTAAATDDPTPPNVVPTRPSGWDDPIEPIHPVDPVQPPQGD